MFWVNANGHALAMRRRLPFRLGCNLTSRAVQRKPVPARNRRSGKTRRCEMRCSTPPSHDCALVLDSWRGDLAAPAWRQNEPPNGSNSCHRLKSRQGGSRDAICSICRGSRRAGSRSLRSGFHHGSCSLSSLATPASGDPSPDSGLNLGPAHHEDTQYLRVFIGQLRVKIERDPTAPAVAKTEPDVGSWAEEP